MAEPYAPLLYQLSLLGGTEETVSGTFPTISAAFAANIYDAKLEPLDFLADGERKPGMQFAGNVSGVVGKKLGRLTFKEELVDGGPFLALLTGAGFVLETGSYHRTSDMSERKTWGFKLWENGRLKGIAGACGDFSIDISAGRRVLIDWTWTGVWQDVADAAMPATTPLRTQPYMGRGATLTINSAAVPHHAGIQIKAGNVIAERNLLTAASGVAHFIVSDFRDVINLDPEARLVAQLDTFGLLAAGTEHAFSLAITDGTNHITIAAPKCQRLSVADQERDRVRVDAIELGCNINAGDDDLTFTET